MRIACTLSYVQDAVVINTTFDDRNNKYKLNIHNISDRAAEALSKEFGIKVKKDDAKGNNINAKSLYPWKFFDDAGNEVDPKTIGNGTKAVVNVTGAYDHKFARQYGKGPITDSGVTITELVPYVASSGSGDEEAL